MRAATPSGPLETVVCPFSLRVDELACMLNFELADHPVYDGGELQWFDDDVHGTGMLAFLSRRESRRVDYYCQPGLHIDRGGYEIGGGTASWCNTDFDAARLDVREDGVDAEVRFTDVDGRVVEIRVDDRDGRSRRPAGLLAPVSAGIERPISLLLVWMPRFDLVRVTGTPPVIRIDGVDVSIGRLPGRRLHRRHLVKYAAPVVTVELNRAHEGLLPAPPAAQHVRLDSAGGVREVGAEHAGHRARLVLDPAAPALAGLADGSTTAGRWPVEVDGVRLTGGSWSAARAGDVTVGMDVDERWKPDRLPWLMRLVTTVVPVFRRWPTTYRWHADVRLGAEPAMSSRWERTGGERGRAYRRATGSRARSTRGG
jgi:hypothetical protein